MNFTPGLLPRKKSDKRFLAANVATTTYVTPSLIDLRPQLLESSDQGSSSKCAAYGVAGWLEYYNWKYKGVTQQIDPNPIYKRAKQIDGEPNADGTTLDAVVQAIQDLGLISKLDASRIRYVEAKDAQQCLHRYGPILSAFTITDKWGKATPDGWIPDGGREIGGHAVLLCAYSNIDKIPYYGFQNSWGDQGWRGFNRVTFPTFDAQFNYGLVIDLNV